MDDAFDHSPVPSYPDLIRLDGKGFIVIGGGCGIGRQTVHALASAGAKICCVDIERDRAARVAGEVGGLAVNADVTRRQEVERMVTEAEQGLGRLDGFVDIVGMAQWGAVLDITDESWDAQFAICLRHAYLAGQIAGRRMAAGGGGVMVFISSVSGLSAAPYHAAYGAAKAALMAWVKSLAVELGPQNIRANAIAPGTTLTPRIQALLSKEQIEAGAAATPLRRMAKPADVAAVALFLASDLSAYVTGQTVVVDGGMTSKFPYA